MPYFAHSSAQCLTYKYNFWMNDSFEGSNSKLGKCETDLWLKPPVNNCISAFESIGTGFNRVEGKCVDGIRESVQRNLA